MTRLEQRKDQIFPRVSQEEKEKIIRRFHPDYKAEGYRAIRVGPNKDEKTVHELADLLEAQSPVYQKEISLQSHYTTDVLVIGGGGAGAAAALIAKEAGADVLIATKLRLGDSNTVMAEGGMQVAAGKDDSPIIHFKDSMKGGQFKNNPLLLKTLVEEGPSAAQWLLSLGISFDRDEEGNLRLKSGGGTSRARLLTCKDYTGLELMRTLKDAVLNQGINILEFSPVVELLSDKTGACTGAILKNLDTQAWVVVNAKTVILATGGIGRLHIQGFPTSNHFGATADGLPIAYRVGAKLTMADTFQYHPTGVIDPEQMAGLLVTEAIRGAGAPLLNRLGSPFVYELETRDFVAASIIRECEEGRGVETPSGRKGVWLDFPMVNVKHGPEHLDQHFPNMIRQFSRFQINIRKEPILIYPTLHYQNGGIKINVDGESEIKNLFVAGEASGGVHGRNRLMGNSLLDIIVYGRRAGKAAALRAKMTEPGKMTLNHLKRFNEELEKASIRPTRTSPLLFPDYVRKEDVTKQSA
ncbi:MAG: FAD-binding protein [Nitrospirae bacterium]|nr:FAD-binding protein [Nitrospirota bacterium]MBI3351937.1 FAD-binding protein [Nitrospirota bacterium]